MTHLIRLHTIDPPSLFEFPHDGEWPPAGDFWVEYHETPAGSGQWAPTTFYVTARDGETTVHFTRRQVVDHPDPDYDQDADYLPAGVDIPVPDRVTVEPDDEPLIAVEG